MAFLNSIFTVIRDATSSPDEIKQRKQLSDAAQLFKAATIVGTITSIAIGILIGGAGGFLYAAFACIAGHDSFVMCDNIQKSLR